jgi:hypothetical protein
MSITIVVVPLQARCGPEGSRRFRLPDFHDIRHMKVVRSSASRTGRLYPQECSWYSFSLGAESTPGPCHHYSTGNEIARSSSNPREAALEYKLTHAEVRARNALSSAVMCGLSHAQSQTQKTVNPCPACSTCVSTNRLARPLPSAK